MVLECCKSGTAISFEARIWFHFLAGLNPWYCQRCDAVYVFPWVLGHVHQTACVCKKSSERASACTGDVVLYVSPLYSNFAYRVVCSCHLCIVSCMSAWRSGQTNLVLCASQLCVVAINISCFARLTLTVGKRPLRLCGICAGLSGKTKSCFAFEVRNRLLVEFSTTIPDFNVVRLCGSRKLEAVFNSRACATALASSALAISALASSP